MDLRPSRFVPWLLRGAWVLLVPLTGPAFAAALSPTSVPVRTAASSALWAVWAATLLATLVLGPVTLTAVRIVAPAAPAAAVWAAATGRPSPLAAAAAIAAASAAAALALAPPRATMLANRVGDRFAPDYHRALVEDYGGITDAADAPVP